MANATGTLSAEHVENVRRRWPCSGVDEPQAVSFTFDHWGNLVDHDAPETWSDLFVLALAEDAQVKAQGFKGYV